MAADDDAGAWWVDGYHLLRSYDPEREECTVWCGAMDVSIRSAFSQQRPASPCRLCTGPAMSAEVRRAELAKARALLDRARDRVPMPDLGPWHSARPS